MVENASEFPTDNMGDTGSCVQPLVQPSTSDVPVFYKCPEIHLDWFAMSFVLRGQNVDAIQVLFQRFCARYVARRCRFLVKINSRRDGFDNRITCELGEEVASFSWGGNYGFACFVLRGALASRLSHGHCHFLRRLTRHLDGRLTRIDIAADFYKGEVSAKSLARACKRDIRKVMHVRGPEPARWPIDKGKGFSFYIGSEASAKRVVVYEKGRQLIGSRRRNEEIPPDWVRIELRLSRCGGRAEIDLDIMHPCRWAGYIRGLGPWFNRAIVKHMPGAGLPASVKYNSHLPVEHLATLVRRQVRHLQETYGQFFEFLSYLVGDEIALQVLRDEVGEWSQLKRFPNWKNDSDILDLVSSAVLGLRKFGDKDSQDQSVSPCLNSVRDWMEA